MEEVFHELNVFLFWQMLRLVVTSARKPKIIPPFEWRNNFWAQQFLKQRQLFKKFFIPHVMWGIKAALTSWFTKVHTHFSEIIFPVFIQMKTGKIIQLVEILAVVCELVHTLQQEFPVERLYEFVLKHLFYKMLKHKQADVQLSEHKIISLS